MNKKIIFILLVLSFVSGCQYIGSNKEATTIYTKYHQGYQGLDIKFVTSSPPSVVYDQPNSFFADRDEINFLIEIRNKGAFDIGTTISDRPFGTGYLLLHGYDEVILQNLKPTDRKGGIIYLDELDCYGEGVEGKSMYNSDGGLIVIEYPPKSNKLGCPSLPYYSSIFLTSDYYRPNIVATACYEYYTEASPQVCIDPDPYSERVDKSCVVSGISSVSGKSAKSYIAAIEGISGGQGAPVAVTNIEEEAMPGRAQFEIHIKNSGSGEVMHLDSIYDERCGFPSELSYSDFDYVHYVVTMNDPNTPVVTVPLTSEIGINLGLLTVSGKQLDCSPKSPIRLDQNGMAVIYCNTANFDLFEKTAYKTPLNIILHYGYTNSAYKIMEIRSTT